MSVVLTDKQQINRLSLQILDSLIRNEVADVVDDYVDEVFRTNIWPWENNTERNETLRKNGTVVGTPRDIYDLGKLYQSEREFTDNRTSQVIHAREWEARNESGQDYAPYVHDGRKHPARPWTDKIKELHEDDLAALVERKFAERWNAL